MDSLRAKKKLPTPPPDKVPTPRQHSLDLGSESLVLAKKEPGEDKKPVLGHGAGRTLPRRPKYRGIFFRLFFLLCLVLLSWTFFLFAKVAHISKTLSFESQTDSSFFLEITEATRALFSSRVPLRQTDENRINILLLGRAGEHYPGKNLTDTIMLASINTKTHQVALLSFPRDLYTPIGSGPNYTKINAIYQIGLDTKDGVSLLRETVEHISGEPVHYSLIVDFDGFEKTIDALGGISVDVPRDLLDTRYPGKNYSYETFEIKKGWQKLDGATALKYVRERHADPEGDFGRARRQQQVMQAVRDKAFSTGTFLNIFTLSRLLDALGASIKTDITLDELESFLSLLRTLDTKNITTVVIDAWKKESLLRVSHIPTASGNAFVLLPRTGNWKEIQSLAEHIFSLESLKQERGRVAHEEASLIILSSPHERALAETLQAFLLDELGFASVSIQNIRLEDVPKRSTIQETSTGQKLYSHNALLSRFDLDRASSTPSLGHSENTATDFIFTLGEDLEESGFLGEIGAAPEELSSEVIPPQAPVKKKKKD
jgi:LCP family protein required for cell wall assembly